MEHLLLYVSGHGFGHARRTATLIAHLRKSRPHIRVSLRTTAPPRIFTTIGVASDSITAVDLDSGVIERDALDINVPATVQRLRDLMVRRDELIEREVAALRHDPVSLIAADIPFLAGAIAERLDVPCVAIGNFTWDWIYEPYLTGSNDGRAILDAIRADYARMSGMLRLPLAHQMPQFRKVIDVPAAAHRTALARQEIMRQCGFDVHDPRPRVLIGMRGGTAPDAILAGCRGMPDALFTTLQPLPPFPPDNLRHISMDDLDFSDLLAVHDVVISKFGYGVVIDAASAGTRLLWPRRSGFREDEVFEQDAPKFLATQEIPRRDYADGNWAHWIRRLLASPPVDPPKLDGQEVTTRALLSFLPVQ